LFWEIEGYSLNVMDLPFHTVKVGMATLISVWMAALACFMGCTQPGLANVGSIKASSIQENLADRSQSGLMADMENCHHSGGQVPVEPNDGKPVPGSGISCCPLEIIVTPKWDTTRLGIAPAHDFVRASNFSLLTIRFYYSVEFVLSVWHSGRDTLLETHLLRI
jgi:hypothetical protein